MNNQVKFLFFSLSWCQSFKTWRLSIQSCFPQPTQIKKNDLPTTIYVRLDRYNYLLWNSLVLPLIKGCKRDGYVLGTKECTK